MPLNAEQAWRNAEQRCYEQLRDVLGGEEDVQAYHPDDGLPRTINNVSDAEIWSFEIQGGGEVLRRQTAPSNTWRMAGAFRGFFTTRERTQRIAGLIMDMLPINEGEIDGIVHWCIDENPQVTREVMELQNDLTSGGDVRVWAMLIPMDVVFKNTVL